MNVPTVYNGLPVEEWYRRYAAAVLRIERLETALQGIADLAKAYERTAHPVRMCPTLKADEKFIPPICDDKDPFVQDDFGAIPLPASNEFHPLQIMPDGTVQPVHRDCEELRALRVEVDKLKYFRGENEYLKTELHQLKKEHAYKLAIYESEIANLQKLHQKEAKDWVTSHNEDVAKLQDRLTTVSGQRKDLQELHKMNTAYINELAGSRNDLEAENIRMHRQCHEKDILISRLRREVTDLSTKWNICQDRVISMSKAKQT